jgi:hypothetical protein
MPGSINTATAGITITGFQNHIRARKPDMTIETLQKVLEHLDEAKKILVRIEKPAKNNWPETDLQRAMEKVDDASTYVTRHLKNIEEQKMYIAKGGRPWPAVWEDETLKEKVQP